MKNSFKQPYLMCGETINVQPSKTKFYTNT